MAAILWARRRRLAALIGVKGVAGGSVIVGFASAAPWRSVMESAMSMDRRNARSMALRFLAGLGMLFGSAQALADAELTLTPMATTCSVTSGTTAVPSFSSFACAPSPGAPFTLSNIFGFSPSSPIQISRVALIYAFTYSDDGLRLASPATLDVGTPTADTQLPEWDPNFLRVRTPQTVSFESATLALHLDGSGASPYYSVSMFASGTDPGAISLQNGVLMFGLNDHPDDFSGTLTISIGSPALPATLTGVAVDASVASVSAVPEASTTLLMAFGLVGLAWIVRRDRRAQVRRALTANEGGWISN
jgi:PEP-CTERM motif